MQLGRGASILLPGYHGFALVRLTSQRPTSSRPTTHKLLRANRLIRRHKLTKAKLTRSATGLSLQGHRDGTIGHRRNLVLSQVLFTRISRFGGNSHREPFFPHSSPLTSFSAATIFRRVYYRYVTRTRPPRPLEIFPNVEEE